VGSSTAPSGGAWADSLSHLVETRSPAPGGQDVVRYSFYDASQRLSFQSVPYFVAGYTSGSAYSIPDTNQVGTAYTYDRLGRATSTRDALSFQTRSRTRSSALRPGPATAAAWSRR
jgi:YD repeat-containing protein